MRMHRAAARALRDNGVDTIFGLIGDGNMFNIADFTANENGRYVAAVTEGAALSMADAYGRVSGKVGVASVTHGPGAASTVNSLMEAVRARTPLVLLTADTSAKRHGHPQNVDLRALFAPTGADHHQVTDADQAVGDIAAVLARAAATNRPCVLDLPIDLQVQDVEYVRTDRPSGPPSPPAPSSETLDGALGLLASANRPLILAGRGAVLSQAGPSLRQLADLLGAPLATTASAKGLFAGHPYNLGIMGNYGSPWAADVIAKADCVAAFGAALNNYTTHHGDLLQGRVIHVDTDQQSLGRYAPVEAAVVADAAAAASAMVEQLTAADITPTTFRTDQLGKGVIDHDFTRDFRDRSGHGTVDLRTATILLDRMLPADKIVVTDGGRFIIAPFRYSQISDARNFVHPGAWASIGLGIASAVGAAVARPDLLTVAICGDGGAMMGLVELSTAVRQELPLLVVVLNDSAYGAEYPKLQRAGFDPSLANVPWPDFAGVAAALGGDGVTVTTCDELLALAPRLHTLTRPLLIDIKVDPLIDPSAD